jgi:hypothetical protein
VICTKPNRGIGKTCKDCGKTSEETVFGTHKRAIKNGVVYDQKSTCKSCESARAKRYRQDYPDRIAESKNRYHEKHHGTIKHHVQEKIATWRKASNVPSNLTVEYLIELYDQQDGYCFYSGEEMIFGWVDGKIHHNSLSLDKLDPAKGYIKDNVVWCTYLINTMKQNMTDKRFYDTIDNIFNTTYGVPMINNSLRDKLQQIVLDSKVGSTLPKVIEKDAVNAAEKGKYECRIYFSSDSGKKPFYSALGPTLLNEWQKLTNPEMRFGNDSLNGTAYGDAVIDFTKRAVVALAEETGLDITLLPWPIPVNGGRTINEQNISAYQSNEVVLDVKWDR